MSAAAAGTVARAAAIFVRKGIQYRASTAILCKAGSDLGNLMHGFHDFQLSDDVLHKVHIGHYTFYSKAVVKNPKMMIRAPGVFARAYIRGEDRNFDEVTTVTTGTAPVQTNFTDVMHINELLGGTDPDTPSELQGGSLYSMGNVFMTGAKKSNYYIRGTCYLKENVGNENKVTKKTINSLGFGESTYPGARYAREGRGVCLAGVNRTLSSMI